MLFEKRFWQGIADDSVTVTFRRRRRLQVLAGRSYRTAAGIVDVVSVTVVEPASVTDADAIRAGYPDAATLLGDLRGTDAMPVHRIEFRRSSRPDPRAEVAADSDLSDGDVAGIERRLDRLDRASPPARGPGRRWSSSPTTRRPGRATSRRRWAGSGSRSRPTSAS
ncbi:MAG: hypothetical protein ACRDWI_13725 [Jiangellaceae bacterium]